MCIVDRWKEKREKAKAKKTQHTIVERWFPYLFARCWTESSVGCVYIFLLWLTSKTRLMIKKSSKLRVDNARFRKLFILFISHFLEEKICIQARSRLWDTRPGRRRWFFFVSTYERIPGMLVLLKTKMKKKRMREERKYPLLEQHTTERSCLERRLPSLWVDFQLFFTKTARTFFISDL